MADLVELARPMLLGLNENEEATPFLAAYDMRIQFAVSDGETFRAELREGRVAAVERGEVDRFSNRDDIELFGSEAGFRLIFERRATPATALAHGKVTPRGERAKHCQAALTFCLLRIAQERPIPTEPPAIE